MELARDYCGQANEHVAKELGIPHGSIGVESARNKAYRVIFWEPGFWYTVSKVATEARQNNWAFTETGIAGYMRKTMSNVNGVLRRTKDPRKGTGSRLTAIYQKSSNGFNFQDYILAGGYPEKWEKRIANKIDQKKVC